jgi:hypothetical protein
VLARTACLGVQDDVLPHRLDQDRGQLERPSERTGHATGPPFQGVSVGWIDEYHHSLEGQEVDLTGASAGVYDLRVNVDDERLFLESDYADNVSWVSLRLLRDTKGNPKISLISHSPCSSPNMCGEALPNR